MLGILIKQASPAGHSKQGCSGTNTASVQIMGVALKVHPLKHCSPKQRTSVGFKLNFMCNWTGGGGEVGASKIALFGLCCLCCYSNSFNTPAPFANFYSLPLHFAKVNPPQTRIGKGAGLSTSATCRPKAASLP